MDQMVSSPYRRLLVAIGAMLGLFVLALLLFPDVLAVFPVIVVPIWLALFPANRQYVARTRRVLLIATIGGVLTLLAGIAALILAS